MKKILVLFAFSLALSGRLVWDQQIELNEESPRYDIYVGGDGLVILHDRLGEERRVRFVDGKLAPNCSPNRFSATADITTLDVIDTYIDTGTSIEPYADSMTWGSTDLAPLEGDPIQ